MSDIQIKSRIFSFLWVIFLPAVTILVITGPYCSAEENGTVLVCIYASGNTLEKDYGWVTSDFSQMVKGAGNVTPGTLEILAAYGGADKPGWNGVTIANLSLLKKDLTDGILGNNASYISKNSSANMGDPKTLENFIRLIQKDFRYERIFLVFIGHGEAYTGMLFDQNHHDDGLTITELSEALNDNSVNFEMFGFDTCLMSCLEAASVVRRHASYLIASEESEPAEGWNYEKWIRYLAGHPNASAVNYSQILFDEYLNLTEPGKTISLLDLKSIDLLTSRIEKLGKDLSALSETPEGVKSIEETLIKTQQFGLDSNGSLFEATMDIYDFSDKIKVSVPYLSESADGVIDGVDKTVILARHDSVVPRAHGIAILSPVLINPVFFEYYKTEAFITPGWENFIKKYLKYQYKNISQSSGS
jgi:hypothetical protein